MVEEKRQSVASADCGPRMQPVSRLGKATVQTAGKSFSIVTRLRPILAAALLSSLSVTALAQTQQPIEELKTDREVVFSADQGSIDPETRELVARGNVIVLHKNYRLEAEQLRYDDTTGVAVAEGGVRITNPDGSVFKASRVTLSGELLTGVIENARLILVDGSRVAANRGERFENGDSELRDAVFSPCPVCDDKPNKQPLWQIKAMKVVHDRSAQRLIYENAFFEILGVPVFWVPYLSHPDPTVERATGLLIPDIRTRQELGVVARLPVFINISDSKEATITPIIASKEAPVLAAEYRQHMGVGYFDVSGSVTHGDQPSEAITGISDNGLRGHLFANGRFVHGDKWQSSFRGQLTSDDTFLRLYDFTDVDTLTSSYRLEGFLDRTYISAELLGFRGLRLEDRSGVTGHALPWINADYVSDPGFLGGTVEARFNSVQLVRTEGSDVLRASSSLQWQAPVTTALGQRIVFDAFVRGDLYDVRKAELIDDPLFAGANGAHSRGVARGSATFSWPFISASDGVEQIIEPVIQLVASPDGGNPDGIPNEDSRTFELAAGNLFALDRTPGFDIWEGGSRAAYGVKYQLNSSLFTLDALVGQSIRTTRLDDVFPVGTGLEGKRSDFVGAFDVGLNGWVDFSYQFQLDKDDLAPKRHEVVSSFGPKTFRVNIGYLRINRDLTIAERTNREEIRFDATWQATRNVAIFGGLVHGLGPTDEPVEYESGILYSNDCLELGLTVRKRFTEDRDIDPGTSVIFRVRLRNLGS